jgi:hypothetical protein
MRSRRLLLGGLSPFVLILGCVVPEVEPTRFSVEYATGSIPPPFNHIYTLSGMFEGSDLAVRYELRYRFREGMTAAELAEQGYSEDDDIVWEGRLTPIQAQAWRSLIAETRVGPSDPPMPGSDSFLVAIEFTNSSQANGLPNDRERWEAMVDAIDRHAHAETGAPRPSR